MAAELIMPTAPGPQPSSHMPPRHFAPQRPPHTRSLSYQVPQRHAASANVSPLSTSGDKQNQHQTAASTPSSPKDDGSHGRLMYMPAVLRPNNEFTPRNLTRVNTTGHDNEPEYTISRRLSASGFIPGLATLGQRLSRRQAGDGVRTVDTELDLQLFPQVTALPTREHWKPDAESSVCDETVCKKTFNYFTRRHHCRKCGNIFCDAHSRFEVPLDQDANFNPRAAPSRTCNHCFQQYKSWHGRKNSQASSSASSDVQSAMPPTPIAAIPGSHPIPGVGMAKNVDVAASVPRDWNWSTF